MQARNILLVFSIVAANLISHAKVEACAVCLTGTAGGDRLVDAFNWSVLFLMGAPYAVFGAVVATLFYIRRRALQERGGSKKKTPVLRLAWVNNGSGR